MKRLRNLSKQQEIVSPAPETSTETVKDENKDKKTAPRISPAQIRAQKGLFILIFLKTASGGPLTNF